MIDWTEILQYNVSEEIISSRLAICAPHIVAHGVRIDGARSASSTSNVLLTLK